MPGSSENPAVGFIHRKVILAYEQNGEALTTETGGPVRLVSLGPKLHDNAQPKTSICTLVASLPLME